MTNNVKWNSYIERARTKANSMSYTVLKSFRSQQPGIYISLYKTYVRPLLEYNTIIWAPQSIGNLELAEKAQRSFTKRLCKKLNISFRDYEDRLKILKIESLEYRRLKTDLILTYKIINNLIDLNIPNFFTFSQVHSIYSLRRHTLYLEKSDSTTPIRQNFFSKRIINTWNALPNSIITSETLTIFKHRITNFPLSSIYKFVFK